MQVWWYHAYAYLQCNATRRPKPKVTMILRTTEDETILGKVFCAVVIDAAES